MAKSKSSREGHYSIEDILKIPQVYAPRVSHSRRRMTFYWDKTGKLELYIMDLRTKRIRQVSKGDLPKSVGARPVWSRDDSWLMITKDVKGNEQHDLYRFNPRTGGMKQLTDTPRAQDVPVDVSPDGAWFSFTSNRDGPVALFKIKAETAEVVKLAEHKNPITGGRWSPDGERLAYGVNESKNLVNQDVWLVKADGSEKRLLIRVKEGSKESFGDWSPDGRLIAFGSDATGYDRVGLFDMKENSVRWLSTGKHDETPIEFSQDGKMLLCSRNRDACIELLIYDMKPGEERLLNLPPGVSTGGYFVLGDKFVVGDLSTTKAPPSIFLYSLKKDEAEMLIQAELGALREEWFVEGEYTKYKSTDNLDLYTLVYKPKDIGKEKLPAIVIPHGGPTGQYYRNFSKIAQLLADRGYVVLLPNVRGSTGYGVEFRDMNIKDWGGGDLEDIAAGVEYLKVLPYVDPKRIGIYGASYGGYMTYIATVKKPELWGAACAHVGITDLLSLYENSMSHFKYYLQQQMGDPEKDRELWKDRSALYHADDLRCPILIIQGLNDPRCPVQQARIYREKLDQLGKEYEYRELDYGHGSQDLQERLETYGLLLDFFQRKL
jgi:dipeptidyl aminopeptidase/acylaminoacyl peptidase